MKTINLLFLAIMMAVVSTVFADDHPPFVPPAGKTILFVGQDGDTIAKYVKGTGCVPGGTMLYISIQEMKGLEAVHEYGAGPQYGQGLVKKYPRSAIQIGLYMVGALDDTMQGKYDQNIKKLARWLKKTHRPVFLRIGYEFDSPLNHYDPLRYTQVFRYIVKFLRREGVHNVAYVWHSYSVANPNHPWMDWYPGDDYVDWFGASFFATNQDKPVSELIELARAHEKPFMIAESTTNGLYILNSRVKWFKRMFNYIAQEKIEAFCYIDSNWDKMPMFKNDNWGDARIEAHPELTKVWLDETDQDKYLKASDDLFSQLGYDGS